jgi:hypothetical protein
MTGDTKESLRQRLTAIQHKDRWDDRDRKEVRAIQAALSCLAQHIPEPRRERPSVCCGAHGEADSVGCKRYGGKTDESASPAPCTDGCGTDAGGKAP